MYCLYVNWARSQEFHSSRHMCCGDMTIKVIWFDLLRFKKAQITVNFFMVTWLKFYKFTGSHAFYLLHYRKQTLLQTSHHVLKPLASLVPRQTAQLSPQTDGPRGEGFVGLSPGGKMVRVLKTRHLNPCTGLECVCVFAVLMRRVCVCLEHCLLAIFQHHMHRLVKKCISLLFWLLLHATLFWD